MGAPRCWPTTSRAPPSTCSSCSSRATPRSGCGRRSRTSVAVRAASVVETAAGRVRGRAGAYLGIPYAAPPLGDRRWAPPAPVEPWSGELDAVAPGPPAPQPTRPITRFAWGDIPPGSEDCLYLNVWTPRSGGGRWPVLVFLIGGGWTTGWTGSGLDDGTALA